ncbi:MAG: hypothetical protein PHD06_08375 [Bacteroidales bacterium]|jgi:hypothetical protein|nr:hypothetical protein [Bacteroidales bacterium]MDY0198775.1 hypothetical protein [Tenuifilaceae bacterium]
MEKEQCSKVVKCALFNGIILKRSTSEDVYKNLFCNASKEKWTTCKRYQVSEKAGKCADWILPNSTLTVDEIIKKMKEKGELV